MTDVKGDRSLSPSQQEDPDMFVHVVKRDEKGVYITAQKHIKQDASILIGLLLCQL